MRVDFLRRYAYAGIHGGMTPNSTPSSPSPTDLASLCRALATQVLAWTLGTAALTVLWRVVIFTGG